MFGPWQGTWPFTRSHGTQPHERPATGGPGGLFRSAVHRLARASSGTATLRLTLWISAYPLDPNTHQEWCPVLLSDARHRCDSNCALADSMDQVEIDHRLSNDQVASTWSDTSSIKKEEKETVPVFNPPPRFYWAFASLSLLALGASFSLTSFSIAVVVCPSFHHPTQAKADFFCSDNSSRVRPLRAKGILAGFISGIDVDAHPALLRMSL